ncbi:MAG: hypothetical protein WDW38_004707 [Sanguina aurantia]
MTSHETSEQPEQPAWKALGRDTAAGRALFKLYKGHEVGNVAGNKYHDRNAKVHGQKLAAGWSPAEVAQPRPPAVVRPKVAVPKFGGRSASDESESRGPYIPHRKPGAQIVAEMQEQQSQYRQSRHPVPSGALLDDREKERCAVQMQYRGKAPKGALPPASGVLSAAATSSGPIRRQAREVSGTPVKSELGQLQDLFDSVVGEIDERQQFLDDMLGMGALKPSDAANVRIEIAVRAKELQTLDHRIQALQVKR